MFCCFRAGSPCQAVFSEFNVVCYFGYSLLVWFGILQFAYFGLCFVVLMLMWVGWLFGSVGLL